MRSFFWKRDIISEWEKVIIIAFIISSINSLHLIGGLCSFNPYEFEYFWDVLAYFVVAELCRASMCACASTRSLFISIHEIQNICPRINSVIDELTLIHELTIN